jgi:hypothetical protein
MNDNVAALRAVASREGSSLKTPVMIAATTVQAGVPAEYAWLKNRFGVQEQDWKVDMRSLSRTPQGRTVETFRLLLRGGTPVDVHFDITSFHQL